MANQWHMLIRNLLDTGMTQTEVAGAIGVTQGAVSQVLNSRGKRGFGFASGNALINLHAQRCAPVATGGLVTRGDLRPHDCMNIWPDIAPLPQSGANPRESSHV